MCAIVGALLHGNTTRFQKEEFVIQLCFALAKSIERGRDGYGWLLGTNQYYDNAGRYEARETYAAETTERDPKGVANISFPELKHFRGSGAYRLLANFRAEPTTEYVAIKEDFDQQPYSMEGWHVVHNGTIANDHELRFPPGSAFRYPSRIDSAAILEQLVLHTYPGSSQSVESIYEVFDTVIRKLKGSYAILVGHRDHPNLLLAAANYRPLWYAETPAGLFVTSAEKYLPPSAPAQSLPPYTIARFRSVPDNTIEVTKQSLYRADPPRHALVVASGGLDSTVAATELIRNGFGVCLLHFVYGCRAETKEMSAILAIARDLGCPHKVMQLNNYAASDSRLFEKNSMLAGGEAGAEFAHEWVPARNLVMLSIATAYAEANNFGYIALGNNLEEAGAYPDNEPEFINRFNKLLPFAVADGKQVRVIMPVGNLMKHEIVKRGLELDAPLDKTWSCYRNGRLHCGKCGPCYMRRTAFEINGAKEVIEYEE